MRRGPRHTSLSLNLRCENDIDCCRKCGTVAPGQQLISHKDITCDQPLPCHCSCTSDIMTAHSKVSEQTPLRIVCSATYTCDLLPHSWTGSTSCMWQCACLVHVRQQCILRLQTRHLSQQRIVGSRLRHLMVQVLTAWCSLSHCS